MTDARLLGGRYELGPVLGYGGMAEVHLGRDHRLGRDVAIKVLRSDLARDPGFQARFRREAQNAAALNHPAIVSVYDTGEDMGGGTGEHLAVPFIVMEFVEGLTLKEVLTAETRLMPERALEIVADVCAALDFSHRHGIIHRDIKPGNVMLTPAGAVKVMDFGIARAISSASASMTATSAVIGTAQYLSPEQARGETVDARSDVYSTGCLLYELLVGEPPFTGDNPVSVAYQHVREDPIPPSERAPGLSPTIDAIVLKAMAKNPINRYQSAAEMRADMLRAVAGRPVSATPVMSSNERTALMGGAQGGYNPNPYGDAPTRQVTPQPRKGKGTAIAIGVLAVLALIAIVAFAIAQLSSGNSNKVAVPNVVGKKDIEAIQELKKAGFGYETKKTKSSAEKLGVVIEQNPGATDKAALVTKVQLTVGAGPTLTKVPGNLVDNTEDGAKSVLAQAKLKANVVEVDSDKPKGQVVSVSPGEGEAIEDGGTVTLSVSKESRVLVPQVAGLGLGEEEARAKLEGADFNVNTVYVANAATAGQVIRQSPAQGSSAKKGSTVTITVSKGPGGTNTSPPPGGGPTTSTSPPVTTPVTPPETSGPPSTVIPVP
jgi:beta-lactam-binding protein with PASTA domain/predicted Ser/Thr protein kinase